MKNAHVAVIEAIVDGDVDFAAIGKKLAAVNPELFMDLLNGSSFVRKLELAVATHHLGKIGAIILTKAHYGWDLKACKHWVESLDLTFTHDPVTGMFTGASEVADRMDMVYRRAV